MDDYYRLAARLRLPSSNEHTLFAAIVPPGCAHIDACFSICTKSTKNLLRIAGGCCSISFDFFLRSTGKSHFRDDVARQLPMLEGSPALFVRVMLLNCLTSHYVDLWRESWDPMCKDDNWTKVDMRLSGTRFSDLDQQWSLKTPLRSDYERRQALIEIDVLVAMELGLSADELCSIYRIQFPVLRQYERNTFYDRQGRIVYLDGDQKYGLSTPEWSKKRNQRRIERKVVDDTLPEGTRDRVIVQEEPFDQCDREVDYRNAWAEFERRHS